MSDTFLIIGGTALILIPIPLIIFLVQLFRKKKSKKLWGIITAVLILVFAIFETIGIRTMCNHNLTLISETPASCVEEGEKISHCSLCDKDITEQIDATGHSYIEASRTDNTVSYKCENCGDEKTEERDSDITGKTESDQNDGFYSDDTVEGELPAVDSDIVEQLIATGYTVEHSTQMQQILNTVGITSLEIYGTTGEAESGLNAMSCYANGSTEDNSRFTMTTEDGVVFYIGFLNEDLYDVDQGGFLKLYTDVHIPETEVDWDTFYDLQELAIKEVKDCLNYPDTANFKELSWAIGRSDDNYKIIGEVTAKNGFGVKDDIYFAVWFVNQNGTFVLEGVTLDGVRVK